MKRLIYYIICSITLLFTGIPLMIIMFLGYSPYPLADWFDKHITDPMFKWAFVRK